MKKTDPKKNLKKSSITYLHNGKFQQIYGFSTFFGFIGKSQIFPIFRKNPEINYPFQSPSKTDDFREKKTQLSEEP